MADDKKTLRIEVVNDSASQQKPPSESPKTPTVPAQPSAPPSPQTPPSPAPPSVSPSTPSVPARPSTPAAPPSPPQAVTPTVAPPVPTVGIPNAPPQVNVVTPPTGPPAPPTPRVPAAPAAPTGAGGGLGASIAAGASEIIGPALVVVGVAVAAIGALATAVTLVSAAFGALAQRLQEYDPGIATASGVSEMRKTQGDIQQAHDLSKEMQGFIERRTTADLTLQRIETSLTQTISPAANKLLDIWEQLLQWVLILVEIIKKVAQKISELDTNAPGVFNALLVSVFGPGVVALFGGLGQLKTMLMQWLNIQLDENLDKDANAFQKDIMDALDPHRRDLNEAADKFEGRKAGAPLVPRRF